MSDNFQSYSNYIPNDEVFSTGPQLRTEAAVHRVILAGGNVSESSEQAFDRGHSGQVSAFSGTSAWQATARTPAGRAVADIGPDTLVEFDGLQAKVSFWQSEGRLTKAADGTYSEASNVAPVEQPKDGDFTAIADEAMTMVNTLLEPLPQVALDGITAHAAGVASGRLSHTSLVAKFATASSISLEDSAARLNVITAIYQGQTDQALQSRHGIGEADRADFYDWCKTNKQGQMTDAVSRQMNGGDVSGWAPLASQWLSQTAPSMEAIKAAGNIPVRGNEIFIQGHWMTPSAAARANLI